MPASAEHEQFARAASAAFLNQTEQSELIFHVGREKLGEGARRAD